MAFKIEFEVTCVTNFGQTAVICGNLPDLGAWNPPSGLRLHTEKKIFPLWRSEKALLVQQGETVQFKLCILDPDNHLVRWELIGPNRTFAPRGPLMVSFADSESTLFCRALRRRVSSQGIGISNVRKGTEDVINDLASDSSSNREMWRQHRQNVSQGSLLLSQFEECLRQAVATQREQPEMQLQNQLEFASYNSHTFKTHYFITEKKVIGNHIQQEIVKNQKIVVTSLDVLQQFQLEQKTEVSLFHLLLNEHSNIEHTLKQILETWYTVSGDQLRGLTILYVNDQDTQRVKPLIGEGLDIVVCSEPVTAQSIVNYAVEDGLKVKSSNKDEFLLFDGLRFVLKVVIYPFTNELFLNELSNNIKCLTPILQKGFFFHYPQKQLRKCLKSTLGWIRSSKCHCLLVLQTRRLQDLSVKTIGDLIDMTSMKYNAIVIVFIYQRFPRNIQDKVPVVKNRMLIINNEGQIYSNGKQAIDIFDYLEVSKSKFDQNCKLITQKIGKGLVSLSNIGAYRVVLEFPKGAFGDVLRERALRCVQDVNKKSLAKIVPEVKGHHLVLIPFVLHPSFLLKVALSTFTQKLRSDEKGLIISVESEGFSEVRWLQPPQGREVNLQFSRFCLGQEQRRRYGSTPLLQSEFHKLLNVMAELQSERKKQIEKKVQILGDVKNII